MSNGSLLPTLTEDPQSWIDSSLLSVNQITGPGLQLLLNVTSEMRDVVRDKGGDDRLKHRLLSTVFYEGSTRTSCSFQAAMLRLGGKTIHVDGNCGNSSAAKKGESLEDTIRCLECYTDVTVLRHPVQGQVGKVIAKTRKPVLNGGDGVGEHPTQALLDVFTIYDELKLNTTPTKTLTVALLGDLKNGRTVHSLAKLLCSGAGFLWTEQLILRYCSAPGLEMPEHITNHIETTMSPNTVRQENVASLSEACRDTNILYVTRIQKERMASEGEYAKSKVCSSC